MHKLKRGPPIIVDKTLQRRTVLEWLGKATVLALGGELVAACTQAAGNGTPLGSPNMEFDAGCDAGTAFVISLPGAPIQASRPDASEIPTQADAHPWNLQLDGRHQERPKRPRPARSTHPHHRS